MTPKELADAIGVSESALRRWVDAGSIRISRTAGGHRRIPVQEAIRFIRQSGSNVVRPELLGLAQLDAPGANRTEEALFAALCAGDRAMVRGLIVSAYLEGHDLSTVFDGPVRAAMSRVGELWQHEPRGIMVEHRASTICADAIFELIDLLPLVSPAAPLAIGGAPEGDPYQLPTLMAGAVMAEAGFQDANFGPNTPLALLGTEAVQRRALVVWVSVSSQDRAKLSRGPMRELAETLTAAGISLVVGGRFHGECVPRDLPNVSSVGSMGELAAFARGLLSAMPAVEAKR